MFDWNEEEIGDAIWGEPNESDDHIVPYPKGNEEKPLAIFGEQCKKECNEEVINVKFEKHNISEVKEDILGTKLESGSQFDANGLLTLGFEMNPWAEAEISRADSAKANNVQLENEPGLFGNDYQEKQDGDFLDDSWDNIGNFDDFDGIFRNDGPIFRCGNLDDADELWSSSIDIFSSPTKALSVSMGSPTTGVNAFGKMSEKYEVKTEAFSLEDQSNTPGHGSKEHPGSHILTNLDVHKNIASGVGSNHFAGPRIDHAAEESMPLVDDKKDAKSVEKTEAFNAHSQSTCKVTGKRKSLKSLKREANSRKAPESLCDDWFINGNKCQQFGGQFTASTIQTFPLSALSPQRKPIAPGSSMFLPTTNPNFSGGSGNNNPVMVAFRIAHPEKDKHPAILSRHGFPPESLEPRNSSNETPIPLKPLNMTPQEKLEKLRRRQQLRAMLAIQEQQQQLGHQVPCIDPSITENCFQENQSHDTEASSIEVDESLKAPLLEINSPQKKDNSGTISTVIDNFSLAESVLDQLQDVIRKLDVKIRLCIRDSLFRLAHSAIQRNNASDTSSLNNSIDEARSSVRDETDNRLTRMPIAETETNPIDRTVAQLLFHRPAELFEIAVKDETLESHSTELLCEAGDMNQFQVSASINTTQKNSNVEPIFGALMDAKPQNESQ